MAIAGQCSSCYYTSPTLQLQVNRRHGHLPQQLQAARRARWPRLEVAAAARLFLSVFLLNLFHGSLDREFDKSMIFFRLS